MIRSINPLTPQVAHVLLSTEKQELRRRLERNQDAFLLVTRYKADANAVVTDIAEISRSTPPENTFERKLEILAENAEQTGIQALPPHIQSVLDCLEKAGRIIDLSENRRPRLGTKARESSLILDHPARKKILEILRNEPGIPGRELNRRIGTHYTGLRFHLIKLQRHRLVKMVKEGGQNTYYLNGQKPIPNRLLTQGPSNLIMEALRKRTKLTRGELAGIVGISRQGIGWHLEKLSQAGLIECEHTRKAVIVRLAQPKEESRPKP